MKFTAKQKFTLLITAIGLLTAIIVMLGELFGLINSVVEVVSNVLL